MAMAWLSDEEIYERSVEELPFAEHEEEARIRYWRGRSENQRMEAAHELMRRHYAKLGVDLDTLQMDKTVVHLVHRETRGQS